jgi:hypothetical protein
MTGDIGRRGFLVGAGGTALAAALPLALSGAGRARAAAAAGAGTESAAGATISRWGVCGHAPFIDSTSYPASSAVAQLQLAAALGATDYRLDWQIPTTTTAADVDWSWYDTVVSNAIDLGIELLPILTTTQDGVSDAEWTDRTALVVSRYAGRIPYYQIQNERDGAAIKGPQVDGWSDTDFDTAQFPTICSQMTAIHQGVRNADSHARTVVNITWKHVGFLTRLYENGLSNDVNALDWYGNTTDMLSVLTAMDARPQTEILVTELDIQNGTETASEADQASYLGSTITALRSSAPAKVHGVYVYELLDQPDRDTDDQRHYGLVDVAANGTWGAHKQAFGTYSAIITAGEADRS